MDLVQLIENVLSPIVGGINGVLWNYLLVGVLPLVGIVACFALIFTVEQRVLVFFGWYVLGAETSAFEASFATYCKSGHAIGVANGLDALLAVAEELKRRGDRRVKLVFIGDGKEKERLAAKAAELGLTNCHFFPPVPKADLGAITASRAASNVPAVIARGAIEQIAGLSHAPGDRAPFPQGG